MQMKMTEEARRIVNGFADGIERHKNEKYAMFPVQEARTALDMIEKLSAECDKWKRMFEDALDRYELIEESFIYESDE